DVIKCLNDKRPDEAAALLKEADAAVPQAKGMLKGKAFESLRDCDDVLAAVIEIMAPGRYAWVPLEQIASVTANPPKFPRDLHWIPSRLELRQGMQGKVFLPALYPKSHESGDDQIRLGRLTDWVQPEVGPVTGRGLHMFMASDDTMTLLEWRELVLA